MIAEITLNLARIENKNENRGYTTMEHSKLTPEQQDQLLFMMLVQQNQQIALMGMGKEPNPATNKTEKDLKAAKYAIDTLDMLRRYTEATLSTEMKTYLDSVLNDLRLSYVKESKA